MMIPKSFKLLNRTYNVQYMNKDFAEANKSSGDCSEEEARIRISEGLNKELKEHTFYHELVHALLAVSTKPKMSEKEAFVDSLGAALHQYRQTKKGQLPDR